ncbi:hypothetical protein [Cellulomonas sp. URHB0016]
MTQEDLVPAPWRDAFVLAMRERDADGRRIGDALAEVRQFCADSGQQAAEAFGAPAEFAAGLVVSSPEPSALRDLRRSVPDLVGLVGMLLVLWAGLADGDVLTVTVGQLAGAAVIAVSSVVVARLLMAGRALVVTWLVCAALLAVVVALLLLATAPVVAMPVPVAVVTGAVLLVGEATWQTLRERSAPTADVVADPFEPAEHVRRRNVRWSVAGAWLMPALTVLVSLVLTVLDRLLDAAA